MNITECIPLPGRGLVARRGHLVALTGGTDAGPDPLLTALTAVAYSNGDGAALALAATRAAAERGGRPAWACAGVTLAGEVAVLVHGEAVALVSADGSPEAQVTASDSAIPVTGTFTGAVVTVRLVISPPAPPDPRLWLEAGTVFGGGIALTIRQAKPSDLTPDGQHAPAAAISPAMEQAAVNMVLHPPAAGPAVPAPPGVAPGEVYPQDELPLREAHDRLINGRSSCHTFLEKLSGDHPSRSRRTTARYRRLRVAGGRVWKRGGCMQMFQFCVVLVSAARRSPAAPTFIAHAGDPGCECVLAWPAA